MQFFSIFLNQSHAVFFIFLPSQSHAVFYKFPDHEQEAKHIRPYLSRSNIPICSFELSPMALHASGGRRLIRQGQWSVWVRQGLGTHLVDISKHMNTKIGLNVTDIQEDFLSFTHFDMFTDRAVSWDMH